MSVAEIWLLSAIVGTGASLWNLMDSWRDLRALPKVRNGRHMIAFAHVRRELIRATIQGMWAAIGLFVVLTLPRASSVGPVAWILVLTNILVTANTVLDARDRIRLRRILNIHE